ncbi:MAG: hypothetical protein IJS81_01090 [Selenomonadaceae bacterium]|nr:hypothetical protein [Selenomonadaceae bacterium]MBQ7628799.1 hypothetical protein [Selenomonadaceae bacterium]
MKYVYPAIFRKDKKIPDCYSVEFPDVQCAGTCGYSLCEAIEEAEDTLAAMLCDYEDRESGKLNHPMSNRIDAPTPINEIVAEVDEHSTEVFVTLIKVDTDAYRKILSAENI